MLRIGAIAWWVVALGMPWALASGARAEDGRPADGAAAVGRAQHAEPRLGRSSTILTPSAILSYGAGVDDELGAGLQLRLDHYPTRYAVRFGGFVQAELTTDGSFRIAGGFANAMWLFGCEVGLAYRSDTGRYASSLGLHLGKSVLLGPVAIGARVTIPLADFPSVQDGQRIMGVEAQVVLAVGVPATLDGPERRTFDCGHRRSRSRAPEPEPDATE